MKPDGVDSGVTEPMVALDADPVLQAEPLGEGQEQVLPASQTEEMQQGEPQSTETPAAATKPSKDKPADPKGKTKGVIKSKTSNTGARPGSTQSRMTNGVQKPAQTNGVAKKTTTGAAADKKTTTTAAKKSVGAVGAVTTKTAGKTAEKKPIGAPKTAGTTQPTKKTAVNGDKSKSKPAALAPRPASAAATKPSTTSSPRTDKPPVAKTTRPATATTSRPASAAPKSAASATSKTPSKTAPSAAKTTTAKPSPAKTPPASRALTTTTKSPNPIKKDASKPATPAVKKSTASPLTRPASTKPSKPDTPKAATPSKPKPTVEAKTSKPKESKPTPSKEINAALKTSSAKSSTTKTTSPKKVVGSSTPMPVKRGPRSAQKENEKGDVAPAVETAAAVEAVAVAAAAATVAGTIFAVTDNESEVLPESKPEVAPEATFEVLSAPKIEDAPEPQIEVTAEPKLEELPEPKLEDAPKPQIDNAPEPELEDAHESKIETAPEPKLQDLSELKLEDAPVPKTEVAYHSISPIPLETESYLAPETESEYLPETTSELLPETKTEFEPEPKSDPLLKTQSESTPETMTEQLIEIKPALASEPRQDISLKSEYDFMSEAVSEPLLETKPEVLPEPRSLETEPRFNSGHLHDSKYDSAPEPQLEFPLETKSEFLLETESKFSSVPEHDPETQFETESEIASEPKSDLLFETESEIAPEPKSDLLFETESEIAPEPKSDLLFETEPEIAPEPKSDVLFETEPEIAPDPKSNLLLETEPEIAPDPNSELLFESEIKSEANKTNLDHLPETSPEPAKSLSPAFEDIAADNEDIPSDTEEETPEEVVPQLNLVSVEHPSASSTLGTTVMSPPSSPTGESPVHMPPQISAPLQDMYTDKMFSSDITTENLDQEKIRLQKDLLSTIDSAAQGAEDKGKSFILGVEPDFLSTSHVKHFSSVSPTSPNMEKEEAVEKAEEEINEDDHNDEEEEEEDEEEQQVTEIVKVQTVPELQTADDFKFGLSESSSTISGVMHYDDFEETVQQEQAETSSPFQMESRHSNEDEDGFSLKKVELEQPFMGPPGVKSFSDEEEEEEEEDEEEQEKEDMDTGPEHIEGDHIHFGHQQASDHHMDVHLKSEEEEEHDDEDVEMVSEGQAESGNKIAENIDEDDYEEEYVDNLNCTAPAPSIPMTAAWGPSNPFVDTWAQPASINITSSPLDVKPAADPETPTKSPAEAWLEKPLCHLTEPQLEVREETESSVPVDVANLCPAPIGMSQSSTLSGTALVAHSSSETSTPEELRDYDSSSGVESRSEKQQTPVPTAQTDQEQDLGIHLERGDCEEEEAETLPADEILGDAPTAPASVPSSPTTSGDEASDTEGEMQINDPDASADDPAALDSPSATRDLPALDEDEEANDIHAGEEDGGTPQSANSVASYGFDCSVSNSNAHSTAESCGKSPGIFSLENEDQLPEEAKDPSLIKELTLHAAAAQSEDLLGCPVDLLPLGQQGEPHPDSDGQYLLCGKTGASAFEESGPESPIHLSPQHGENTNSQPPYYSTICDNTDSFLAGYNNPPLASGQYVNLSSLSPEVNEKHYLNLHKPLTICPQQQKKPSNSLVELPVSCHSQASQTGQLKRLEQHQLHLRHIWQRQEHERQQRLWMEGERQRQELQKQLERQQALRQWQKQERLRMERQKQLQMQRQELARLYRHQEHRQRWQLLQWQLELEQRLKRQQKGLLTKPLYGLGTIYEAMEISEDEYVEKNNAPLRKELEGQREKTDLPLHLTNRNLPQTPRRGPDWIFEMNVIQKLINQHNGCPPLLCLPGQGGGTLSSLERSSWPQIMHQLNHASATITSVSRYSPTQGSSPQDDWTIVELETYH